jgi:hypothetical protein
MSTRDSAATTTVVDRLGGGPAKLAASAAVAVADIHDGASIAVGGFGLAGPWSSAVGLVALVLAWRFLPRRLRDAGVPNGPVPVESL